MTELRAHIFGRVQLVMYRDFVCRKARRLGLVGYAKNLPDGSVEVVAQGAQAVLETLVQKLHRGSLLSRVEKVEVEFAEVGKPYSNFSILW